MNLSCYSVFLVNFICYILICHIITTPTIKTQEDFFNKYMYLSLYCKGSKRVIQGLRVRGSWRPNINCNILTPTLMAVNVVSFLFSWCSTGGPGVHSAGCWLSLLHLISNFSGPQTSLGFPSAPSAGCGFPYHISSITPSPTVTVTWTVLTSVLTELYNSSTPTQSPTRSLKSHV